MPWLSILALLTSACSVLLLSACASPKPVLSEVVIGPGYTPSNVYLRAPTLPPTLRRVAVLPLSYDPLPAAGVAGQEQLEPILHLELTKTGRFEPVFIKPSQLRQWTGRERWDHQEELPAHLLKFVQEQSGCDGILFAHLSHFHAYPPIVIGWRFRLISSQDGETLWSVDEVFDASQPTVSNSARRYSKSHVSNNPVLEDSRSILLSPRHFGQYTLAALLATLPGR